MNKLRQYPEAVNFGTSKVILSIVFKILFCGSIDDDERELDYNSEMSDAFKRIFRHHLSEITKAQKGRPVVSKRYKIAATMFPKSHLFIAKLAETTPVRDNCVLVIDTIVRRTIEVTLATLCNALKEHKPIAMARSSDGFQRRGMWTSYSMLQACLEDMDYLLPPAELRQTPTPAMTALPIGCEIFRG